MVDEGNKKSDSDEEIIELYRNGDQEAFKRLIDRYKTALYNFTARLTNKEDAPDIVAEIFIKVWKNIGRFDKEKASFKTWIFTIGRNAITDFLRKKKNLLFRDMQNRTGEENNNEENGNSFEENIPDENILPDGALQKLQDREFLNNTLKKLSLNEKEILLLHYQEEMTFDEIGKVLDKSLNTVKSAHRRALIKLRKILQ
ncbi:MAG TPA: sigma-70 family RNA polymerase sigma factor [Candidatus Paceibacterota bacterium]|jgi:RNA polymerase sigma-70 factor (ECF subfamily)|nr:sigma-70 family RNA polymerase sigma factor [Candidatus Paceibacterota bacterium]